MIDMKERIKKVEETLGDINNSIELIAIALNVTLPGRESRPATSK
jgi:tetrahydromethanopterin S-methyltransferase subunit B